MKSLEDQIKELKNEIIELDQKLKMEILVKKSEVGLNKTLKETIEKNELHIETLVKINEEYSNIIAKLRIKLKNLINEG
jgi:chaperonin cofactor prefoldin